MTTRNIPGNVPGNVPTALFCEQCGIESDGAFNVDHYTRGVYLGAYCARCWDAYNGTPSAPIPYALTDKAVSALGNPWHGNGTLAQRHGCDCHGCAPRLRDVLVTRAEDDMTDHEGIR